MTDDEKILKELESIKKLLALTVVADLKGDAQIERLSSAGLGSTDIANLLGKTHHSVEQALYRIRKNKKSRSGNKSVKQDKEGDITE